MKIRHKKGSKFDGDRIYTIETNGKEVFTHARLMVLINALAKNEWAIYNQGGWADNGHDFLFDDAIKDAIEMGIRGEVLIDEKDPEKPMLKEFCERHKLMGKFSLWKQTILNEFGGENESS